jgi:K+ transporter
MLFNPKGFWLLGAIFLCTTGAEALYSDLGHVGKENIRISWIFVKTALVLNYFGQGVWLLQHEGQFLNGQNPFEIANKIAKELELDSGGKMQYNKIGNKYQQINYL